MKKLNNLEEYKDGVLNMNYEEIIKYVQSRCKENIFKEIDNFLTNLDDTCDDTIELENNKFKIRKEIIKTDYNNGIIDCKYDVILQ